MIPILFENDETSFDNSGICRLTDCISCTVTEERNGIYECDFEYPVSGAYYDQITPGRIIACTHDDSGTIQPFDIVSYSRAINGVVAFHAVHISYRQTGLTVSGTGINTLANALLMLQNSIPENPFTYETDKASTGYMAAADGIPRTVRQMLGGVEGSILDTYGGEYEFDGFTVRLLANRGEEKDFTIRYGLNLSAYTEDADYQDTFNAVVPYWYQENTGVIIGAKVGSGLTTYTDREICIPLDLSDKFETQPSAAQLRTAALSYINERNINLPSQNIAVDFVRLQDEDDSLSELMRCNLCDSVNVVFPMYDMSGTFKIVKTVYNVLKGRYDSMELGNLSTSLADALGISSGSGGTSSGKSFRTATYTKEYIVAAGSTINLTGTDFGITAPDGYTPVAITEFRSGSTNVDVIAASAIRVSGNAMTLYNTSTSSKTATASLTILYASQNLVLS